MGRNNRTQTHWDEKPMSDAEETVFERGRMRGRTEGMFASAVVLAVVGGIALGTSAISNSCGSGSKPETMAQQAESEQNAELSGMGGKRAEKKQGREEVLKGLIGKASDKTLRGAERKKALEELGRFEAKDKKEKEAIRSLMEKMVLDPNRQVNKEAMDYVLRDMEPRRALNVFLTAVNQLDAESAWEAASNIGTIIREGKAPLSKEEIRRGLERIVQAQNKFQFSKERMAPACMYMLKEIKLEWNNILWKQNAANTSSSLMRPPKAFRAPVLPYVDKPVKLARNQMARSRC